MTATPRHVAIIMDGNGRWATARGLPRTEGHRRGAEAARAIVEAAADMGIDYLTLFGFSSENWNRPVGEVEDLMNLLRFYLKKETAELHKRGAKLRVIGDRARLSADIVKLIESAEELTANNTKITVVIALSYGGRQEILQAAQKLAADGTEKDFEVLLMTAGMPDPDLVIRTSGESRVSNFLLWQIAYAELYFTDTLWPDFGAKELAQAVTFYGTRERRFGKVGEAS